MANGCSMQLAALSWLILFSTVAHLPTATNADKPDKPDTSCFNEADCSGTVVGKNGPSLDDCCSNGGVSWTDGNTCVSCQEKSLRDDTPIAIAPNPFDGQNVFLGNENSQGQQSYGQSGRDAKGDDGTTTDASPPGNGKPDNGAGNNGNNGNNADNGNNDNMVGNVISDAPMPRLNWALRARRSE
jgi:hypothetical protein